MTHPPDIEWLQRRWDLPESAVPAVLALLEKESDGSTASEICEPVSDGSERDDWGRAVSGTSSPLVLVPHDGKHFLQSRRLFEAESEIARHILERAQAPAEDATPGQLARLFPASKNDDLQMRAARLAATRRLAMITGGPGTGKTYTLARILVLLVDAGIPADRIRLAAPTGKAADRMKQAVTESLYELDAPLHEHLDNLSRVAASSATIHSLLGYHPGRGRCRHHAAHPLPCSVLIIDECSMVDVLLWRALLAALPAECRLILLGDPNQLESVGQGNVFAELAKCARRADSPLRACHVHLTGARRFKDRPAIVELARALEHSDAEGAVALLEKSRGPNVRHGIAWIESPDGALTCDAFPPEIITALEAAAMAPTPAAALEALKKICILTAQREFFVGAKAMSAAIDAHFSARPGVRNHPVIINHNDPETGLRNGTVGVIHRTADGQRRAWFDLTDGRLQELTLAQLPDFSPAWAITIHRSQGSEYDSVLVILPQESSPMATRELLYTAITRARKNVFIAGSLTAVRKAVLTPSRRETLLARHLI